MEARKNHNQQYMTGNVVRKLDGVPNYPNQENPARRQGVQVAPKKVRKPKNMGLDLFSLLMLSLALSATVYVCIGYINAHHNLVTMSKKVATTESEVMHLKNKTDGEYEKLDTAIDLQKVYKVATEKLGMVHASNNQVIPYESMKSDAVRKYGEIPEGK